MLKKFGILLIVENYLIIINYILKQMYLSYQFREFFLKYHEIDPAYCYSAPGLTWQCGLKYTKVKLDLLTDYDMLLMFEQGIRGGYSGVLGDRYVKANNKYVPLKPCKAESKDVAL